MISAWINKGFFGDAVVTGFGVIDGLAGYAYSQDFTVFGGSLSGVAVEKICKVLYMAVKNGANHRYQRFRRRSHSGRRYGLAGYGEIFRRNVMASGVAPQFPLSWGRAQAVPSIRRRSRTLSSWVKTNSYMFITGPEVIKAVTHEEVTKEDLGGAETHSAKSGVAHFTANTEKDCLLMIRELISFLPSNNQEDPPFIRPMTTHWRVTRNFASWCPTIRTALTT